MNFDLNFSPPEDVDEEVGGEEEHVVGEEEDQAMGEAVGEEEDQAMGEAVGEAGKLNIHILNWICIYILLKWIKMNLITLYVPQVCNKFRIHLTEYICA